VSVCLRRAVLLLPFTAVALSCATPAGAWGPTAHRLVHTRAVAALPKGLKEFFRDHRREMATLSEVAGASIEEGAERRFAADRFGPFPFLDLPKTEEGLIRRHGESAREAGRLPWLARESYARLIERFRQGDKTEILEEADRLALLLTDLHNPLALTENYDGQRSEQPGLWVRFSVRLPETLAGQLGLDTDVAHLLDDPDGYVFAIIRATYVWADNILYEDDLAARRGGGYGPTYFEALRGQLRPLLRERLAAASRCVASYWYSAWVAAGKPALESQH
jgi:hypothetical protein